MDADQLDFETFMGLRADVATAYVNGDALPLTGILAASDPGSCDDPTPLAPRITEGFRRENGE